jgi:YebC/PmpR family DNA-binding regulatory protein
MVFSWVLSSQRKPFHLAITNLGKMQGGEKGLACEAAIPHTQIVPGSLSPVNSWCFVWHARPSPAPKIIFLLVPWIGLPRPDSARSEAALLFLNSDPQDAISAGARFRPSCISNTPAISATMAGHNKWSKVKRSKGVIDAKRGQVFSKLSKELTLAVKQGGSSPDLNARLRTAILAAKAANMPGDTLDRAIKKGTGELGGAALEEILYEGYGPGGIALMIEIVTDNRNRAANDLRVLLSKNNGTFADAGSVAYQFMRRGEIRLEKKGLSEDTAMELALDSGADDVQDDSEEWVIYTAQDRLFAVASALKEKGAAPKSPQLTYVPSTTVPITDIETARQILKLYDVLDEYEDTQNIHANFEIPDDVMVGLS